MALIYIILVLNFLLLTGIDNVSRVMLPGFGSSHNHISYTFCVCEDRAQLTQWHAPGGQYFPVMTVVVWSTL